MLTLPRTLQLTPAQFAAVCAANPEAVLELDADGTLIERTPTGGRTSARNQALGALLWLGDRAEPAAAHAVRQLRRLPAGRRLRAQPRCQRGAAGSLAGPE